MDNNNTIGSIMKDKIGLGCIGIRKIIHKFFFWK